MDSQVFYEWRRSRDPSTSPNWYFPHNRVNILRTGVVVYVCVCFLNLIWNFKFSLFPELKQLHEDRQTSFEFFLGKFFQDVQGDRCLIIFFMNEDCAMQMRAIHKKRENMAATSASRLHWHCSNLPPSTPAHQKLVLLKRVGGWGLGVDATWHVRQTSALDF